MSEAAKGARHGSPGAPSPSSSSRPGSRRPAAAAARRPPAPWLVAGLCPRRRSRLGGRRSNETCQQAVSAAGAGVGRRSEASALAAGAGSAWLAHCRWQLGALGVRLRAAGAQAGGRCAIHCRRLPAGPSYRSARAPFSLALEAAWDGGCPAPSSLVRCTLTTAAGVPHRVRLTDDGRLLCGEPRRSSWRPNLANKIARCGAARRVLRDAAQGKPPAPPTPPSECSGRRSARRSPLWRRAASSSPASGAAASMARAVRACRRRLRSAEASRLSLTAARRCPVVSHGADCRSAIAPSPACGRAPRSVHARGGVPPGVSPGVSSPLITAPPWVEPALALPKWLRTRALSLSLSVSHTHT